MGWGTKTQKPVLTVSHIKVSGQNAVFFRFVGLVFLEFRWPLVSFWSEDI